MARLFQFGWVVLVVLGCSGNQPQVAEGPENVPGESQTVEEPHDAPAAVQSEKSRTPVALPELKPLPIPELPDGVTLPNSIEEWQAVINRRDSSSAKFDPVFYRALIHPEESVRIAAYERVPSYSSQPTEALPFLIPGINDPVQEIRKRVIEMAIDWGELGAPAVAALVHCAADPDEDPAIRMKAIYRLGSIGPAASAAIPYLASELDDPESYLVSHCLVALAKLGPEVRPITPQLIRILNSEGGYSFREGDAAAVLLNLGETDAVLKRYKAASSEVRERLLDGLNVLEDSAPFFPLIRLAVKDTEDNIRVAAMSLLVKTEFASPEALEIAAEHLSDSNERVRNSAAEAIESNLKKLTEDPSLDRGQLYDQLRPLLATSDPLSSKKFADVVLGLGPGTKDKLWQIVGDENESELHRTWAAYFAIQLMEKLPEDAEAKWREQILEFTQDHMPLGVRGLTWSSLLKEDDASADEVAVIVGAARLELPDLIHAHLLTRLAALEDNQALDEMFLAARSESYLLRNAGLEAIVRLGPLASPLAPRILKTVATEEDNGKFWELIDCLGFMDLPAETLVEPLMGFATDPRLDISSRQRAVRLLRDFSDHADKIAPRLIELLPLLTQEHRELRGDLLRTLRELGPASAPAIPTVIQLLNSDDKSAHFGCIEFLAKAGPAAAPAVPRLFSLLKEADGKYTRANTLEALASIAPSDPEVLAALIEGLRYSDEVVTSAAIRQLKLLKDNAKPGFDEILAIYQAAPTTDDHTARKFRKDLHTILKQLAPDDPRVPEEP